MKRTCLDLTESAWGMLIGRPASAGRARRKADRPAIATTKAVAKRINWTANAELTHLPLGFWRISNCLVAQVYSIQPAVWPSRENPPSPRVDFPVPTTFFETDGSSTTSYTLLPGCRRQESGWRSHRMRSPRTHRCCYGFHQRRRQSRFRKTWQICMSGQGQIVFRGLGQMAWANANRSRPRAAMSSSDQVEF
jgi:hypothetical protein